MVYWMLLTIFPLSKDSSSFGVTLRRLIFARSSYFGMVEIVAVFVCDILVYMVQKCLVDDNHHHQRISNLCNKVFNVYSYFVEKMGNFHYNPENIRGLGFAYFFGEAVDLFLTDLHNYSCVLQNCFL